MACNGVKKSQRPKLIWKRGLAIVLTLVFVFSGIPFQANAAWGETVKADTTEWGTNKEKKSEAVSGYPLLIAALAKSAASLIGEQAVWGYSENLYDDTGTVKTQLQGNKGTYRNQNGDILYIDTTTGKFAPQADPNNRIQVNKGTKIYVPVKNDKITLVVSIHKNYVGTEADFLSDTLAISGIDGNLLADPKCTKIETEPTDSNYRLVTIEGYLNGTEGEILLEDVRENSIYLKNISISCETLPTVTISGTVTAAEALSADMQVVVINTTTNAQYTADITNGAYSIQVPVEDTEASYELSVSDQNFQISSGTTQYTLSSSSTDITNNLVLSKLSTITLSGKIQGIDAGYDKSNLELIFTAEGESTFTPEVKLDLQQMSYTVKLEKGTLYSVNIKGVNDYKLQTEFTGLHYEADGNLDIAMVLKDRYPITLSLSSKPDLSTLSIVYKFVHEDGLEYAFTDKAAILLRDGTYTFSLEGEFEKEAYQVSSGTTLKVDGKATSHAVTFTPVTSWSFVAGSGDFYNKSIQGGTGYYQGLWIDATLGKLVPNGATPNSAQFNAGAVIHVPVTGDCKLEVTAYQPQYALYTINGGAASTSSASTSYEYKGGEGTIDIVSTGSAYITGITIVYPEKEVEYVPQTVMPFVPGDDTDANTAFDTDQIPRASKSDSIVVQPVGQKLKITQAGGNFSGAFSAIENIGYYVFPMTTDNNHLEFDIIIHSAGSTNGDGAFMGMFTDNYAYTLGIRKGTNARAIYSKGNVASGSDYAGAGGINNTIPIATPLHIEISLKAGKPTITYTIIETGETAEVSLSIISETTAGLYYGMVISDASVTVTNMCYTKEDGTVLYNQNSCYYPEGNMPEVNEVTAKAADSREYIDITWTGTVPEDDGTYVENG